MNRRYSTLVNRTPESESLYKIPKTKADLAFEKANNANQSQNSNPEFAYERAKAKDKAAMDLYCRTEVKFHDRLREERNARIDLWRVNLRNKNEKQCNIA